MSDLTGNWTGLAGTAGKVAQALTKTDHAYLRIRQGILDGHFRPGESLDQEELARELNLSTTPVREAMRRLESERLVIRRAHRDIIVAPLSIDTVEEVYAVRLSLDPLAASLASVQASKQERQQILDMAVGNQTGLDLLSQLDRNRGLHRAIYTACGNGVLVDILDKLWDLSDRYRLVTLHDHAVAVTAQAEHEAIARAVSEGRPDEAADLMREHTAESLQRIRENAQ
ncbi:MAG TPA: GntR family transcriptional regulator [Streptosporangiaceae bacterium]|jgi:DNA-binding GntR family transcriptional regulator